MMTNSGDGGARQSTRLFAACGVGALHLGAVAAFAPLGMAVPLEAGEAPVINLTLEHSPRFDAPYPSSVASTKASVSSTQPATPPLELQLRETPLQPDAAAVEPVAAPSPPSPAPSQVMAADATAHRDTGSVTMPASSVGATQGGGGRVLGAGATSQEDLYMARVIAWIEQNKRSPADTASGVATVRFVLDRRGSVRGVELVRTSGSRRLDQAALDQIRETQPFPRPAPNATWRTREFTLNIEYRRR